MNILPYLTNNYAGNVAIVVDQSSDCFMLSGNTRRQVGQDQFVEYKMLLQSNAYYGYFDTDVLATYNIYTVDLIGYRQLFMQIDNYLYPVFQKWQNLLDGILANDLQSKCIKGSYDYRILSATTGEYLDVPIVAKMNAANMFTRSQMQSAQFINIAIPRSLHVTDFFTETPATTEYDAVHETHLVQLLPETTYTLSDYKFVDTAIGESFALRKREQLKLSIVMTSVDNDYQVNLLSSGTLEHAKQLIDYLTVTEDDDYFYINFIYNPNRSYRITSNTRQVHKPLVPLGSIEVMSADMLLHLQAAKLDFADKYMLNKAGKDTRLITLPQVTGTIIADKLPIRTWKLSDYVYGAKHIAPQLQWSGYSYMYEPVQTIDLSYEPKWFLHSNPIYSYGNLHTFMLEDSRAIETTDADYYKLHTYGKLASIDDNGAGLDTVFSKVDLPTIYNCKVTFRNLLFTFKGSDYDGKKFALVLRHNDAYDASIAGKFAVPSLIASANYVAIILTCNLSTIMNFVGKTAVEDLDINDFYAARASVLLPMHLQRYITFLDNDPGCTCDFELEELQMQPPYGLEQ